MSCASLHQRERNAVATRTFLTLINEWETRVFLICRQKSSDWSFEDFVNSLYNYIAFTKVLVRALFCATGRQLAAMGGTRWGCTRGDGEQWPGGRRQAKPDGPTGGKQPELRAVLARGPSAPPLSPA